MSRWSDLATWRGPTPNQGGAMREVRGVVVHIAAGYFEGTIDWQRNDSANVSSHFIVGRDGRCAQMVDTDVTAWTQGDGNGRWLSVENEGFLLGHRLHKPGWHELSTQMIETNAQLFARAHRQYGVPLQLTSHPTGKGLGYHGMGAENGYDWGHLHCPGEPIKAQLPKILARAIQIVNGDDMGDLEFRGWPVPKLVGERPAAIGLWELWTNEQHGEGPYGGKSYRTKQLDSLVAAAAQDEVRDKAVLAAINALATAGGVEAAPIVAAINAVKVELGGELAGLRTALAGALARAEAAERRENELLAQAHAAAAEVLDGPES